jgi:Mitochondrial carrier protein
LTKVRLQASGDKRMIESIKKTVRTAGASLISTYFIAVRVILFAWSTGFRGLFDGISGTWLRQMSYSMCRFWAYDESKKILKAGVFYYFPLLPLRTKLNSTGKDSPAWKLALAGTMGTCYFIHFFTQIRANGRGPVSGRNCRFCWESRRSVSPNSIPMITDDGDIP